VVLGALILGALILDWKKAILYIILPHQAALFSVLVFNYLQHVHADELSATNHSRNMTGKILNAILFNNGYHTVHHDNASMHWSLAKAAHSKIEHTIHPSLLEKSFWGMIFRVYILGLFSARFQTKSMRLARLSEVDKVDEKKSSNSLALN
jgi:beta-carotene hydroxylase